MRIAVCLQSYWFLRNMVPVLEWLADAGHSIELIVIDPGGDEGRQMAEMLVAQRPAIRLRAGPVRGDRWSAFADVLHRAIDFLHFKGPEFLQRPRIRRRAETRGPENLKRVHYFQWIDPEERRLGLFRILLRMDRALPSSRALEAYLSELSVDLLIVTPLIDLDCNQMEYLRAARKLGLRSLFIVHSWDNLSSKSYLRFPPDHIAVWNEFQRREALNFHHLPLAQVTATGAQNYDEWFVRQPSRDRSSFCREVELDPERPIVLYTCSALFDVRSNPESAFLLDWIARLRKSGAPNLEGANILIRPHPKRAADMQTLQLEHTQDVAVWPRIAQDPVTPEAKRDYFDSLYHADVVVGLNTSAMIEAAIVGKPVLTILTEAFRSSQLETYHYKYLVDPAHGVAITAASLDQHLEQLASMLDAPGLPDAQRRRFLEDFVRPAKLDEPAVNRLGSLIEVEAAKPAMPLPPTTVFDRLLRLAMPVFKWVLTSNSPLISSFLYCLDPHRWGRARRRLGYAWKGIPWRRGARWLLHKAARFASIVKVGGRKAAKWTRKRFKKSKKRVVSRLKRIVRRIL